MAKCAIYVRVSTEEQAKEGYSLDEQEKRCRHYIEMKGDSVFKVYRDEGISGTKVKERTAYLKMMNEMDKWDKVVFWKLDRIHRNARNFMAMADELKKKGKEFASVVDNIDTDTAMGRFALDLFVRIAQLESEVTGERTAMGLKAKVEAGEWITRPVFGYDLVKNKDGKSELVVNPVEAEVVKLIYNLKLKNNYSNYQIVCYLNMGCVEGKQWKTKTGKLWTQVQIKRILSNPVYIGKIRIKDKKSKNGFLIVDGKHEPIVEKEDFYALNPSMREKRD
ncbi:MAG TPA: recombinase family protein [Thermoplasmata archaeon]|nr:recombinase family protein [Thermoplasmata archaeon]